MNKNLMILTIVLLAGTIWAGNYSGGSGTQIDPYQISTVGDWQELMTTSDDWDRHFVLINNLDLADINLIPVGEGEFDQDWNLIGSPFNGFFDGQGYLIQNASIVTEETNFIGIFQIIGPNGVIKNLGLENVNIKAGELSDPNEDGVGDVGGLAGFNNGTITNCYVTGIVSGGGQVGGLVGGNSSWGGGVGIIENCYAIVSVSGQRNVGGLVGDIFQGYITNSYAAGPVSASHWNFGGLVGSSDDSSSVLASFWDMDTSGQTNSAGGTGKTTGQMKTQSTFTDSGWDFDAIWKMPQDNYPQLQWANYELSPDLNNDGSVSMEDLVLFQENWLDINCVSPSWCDGRDLNTDGKVDILDFAILAEAWLMGYSDPVPDADYSGDYEVDIPDFYGYFTIQQDSYHANIYMGYDGPYAGIVDGNVINVILNDENNVGTMELVFSSEGDSFAGTYDIEGVGIGSFNGWLADHNGNEPDITWVSISNPDFNGDMSRYQTTNAQFAQYLNAALASGDIRIEGSYVKGNSGSYSGQNYYRLDGPGATFDGAINGGAARINYSGGQFTVASGFDNHPVTYVSWYGATAFASYYGWRLPTEWEWQAVASYDGAYTYGTGNTINNNIANYRGSRHPHGTTPVGQYGLFGYGMADMAGNVWEWTSSLWDPAYSFRVLRGGSWYYGLTYCTVSYRNGYDSPGSMRFIIGFRVCR